MKRILLVDLGERELRKREELRTRLQNLKSIRDNAATSGGLNETQRREMDRIERQLASDVVIDPLYRAVAAEQQQRSWEQLQAAGDFVHKYGLMGSQRMRGAFSGPLEDNEREIVSICGLLQIDGYTDSARKGFVQKVSQAQGEYREHRALFNATYEQLAQRYPVLVRSQLDKGLIDSDILGCIDPDEDPETRRNRLDERELKASAVRKAEIADERADKAESDATIAANALKTLKAEEATIQKALDNGAEGAERRQLEQQLKAVKVKITQAKAAAKETAAAAEAAKDAASDAWEKASDAAIAEEIRLLRASFVPNDTGEHGTVCALSGRNVAAVVRRLVADKVSANDPWLASNIQNAYDMQTGVVAGAPPSAMEIMLPDLDEATDFEIQRENLHAAQAIYFAHMLEEAHLPQVVERIVELFRAGLLPLGRGKAGDYLFNYYKKASERITEGERRDLYMRVFGAPGGDPTANQPNREFSELWLRFVSAVSSFGRQLQVDRLLRTQIPVAVSQEQVRKAGRDLAANLSLHGFGIAYFAATELQKTILEYRDLLSDAEVRGAFGARDMWQVIDQVNANYLGGTRNTHRFRTQARAGAVVIRWLANKHERLGNRYGEVISINALTNPQLRGSDQPTVDPTDWDLLQACEQWLAVGGVQDESVEQYAQPVESPVMPSKPMEMPLFAREAVESLTGSLPVM